jgi:uncharacterized membrane protein YqhA
MKVTEKIIHLVIAIVVAGIFLAALAFVGTGIYALFIALFHIFDATTRQEAMLSLLETVDLFLIALVFLILAIGLTQLFLGKTLLGDHPHSRWLLFEDFSELKLVLWKTVLTTMLISFFVELYKGRHHPDLYLLIFPASITLIAFSFFLLKSKHTKHKEA